MNFLFWGFFCSFSFDHIYFETRLLHALVYNFCTTCLPYPVHQDISSDTKNVVRGIVIWEISTSILLFSAKFAA